MRKLTITFLALALVLTGCTTSNTDPPEPSAAPSDTVWASGFPANATIGVSFPQSFHMSREFLKDPFRDALTAAGFIPMFDFAEGGVTEQQHQLLALTDAGAKVIIVNPINGSLLGEQLADAKKAGITVIAYGRLLRDTPDVDAYIAYDYCQAGRDQATSLLEGLAANKGAGPYNIELIAGSPQDLDYTPALFNCAMEVLQPKLDDGTLKIPSGQSTLEQAHTDGWLADNAKKRFDAILSDFYTDGTTLDGILSPSDFISLSISTMIEEAGLPIPVATGMDPFQESVESITDGKLHSTIYLNDATLMAEAVNIVKQLQQGQQIAFTDTIDNGAKIVPAYLLEPVTVTKNNACTAFDPNSWPGWGAAGTPLCKGE